MTVNGSIPHTFYQGGSVSGDYEVSVDLPTSELVVGDNAFKFATTCHSTLCALLIYLDDGGAPDHTTYYCDNAFNPPTGYKPIPGDMVLEITPHISVVEAQVNIDPDTLNLKAKGKWITCYVTLPEDYDVTDVVPSSLLLEELMTPVWSYVEDEEQVLKIKFDRSEVQQYLEDSQLSEEDEVGLLVCGELTDGTRFEGVDVIQIINPGK